MTNTIGADIHALAKRLWGINRSLTGAGVRETLSILQEFIPELTLHEVPTGTAVFDWTVPQEWHVREAYLLTPDGEKICDFKKNNLHLVGYSTAIQSKMSLAELQAHLYSLPEQPTAIPYITSYYQKRWGFCLSHHQRNSLKEGEYQVVIDADLFDGHLTYADLVLKGSCTQEVLISTYICHPSMANNELSGITVTTFLAHWLAQQSDRRLTYRFVFAPETIGSITYLSRHKAHLQAKVIAGFNVSCIGDDRNYSYLPSRHGDSLSDQIAQHVLKHSTSKFTRYQWKDRGSDERQYCAPGIDLPIASIMRTKYGSYDEYHTSLDDLVHVVTPEGLAGGYNVLKKAIQAIEKNYYPKVSVYCEPQLGKRGLYPTLSTKDIQPEIQLTLDLITWADGKKSLLEIANVCEIPIWDFYAKLAELTEHGLLTLHEQPVSF